MQSYLPHTFSALNASEAERRAIICQMTGFDEGRVIQQYFKIIGRHVRIGRNVLEPRKSFKYFH